MQKEFVEVERQPKGWLMLFQKLHFAAKANAGSQLVAKKPMNVIRNRYRDVLPIDETRVTIDDEANDYVNANFVEVADVKRKYILTQGPLQHTVSHFWQMIWEQKTVGIVMLNRCIERGMNKCYSYWPQVEEEPLSVGKFRVENLGSEDESCYRLTRLKLENLDLQTSRTVLHFNYIRWPDFGVPQTPNVFLEFLYAVRDSGVLASDVGPCVVHCSAGIGRSGTFCLVDVCLRKVEESQELSTLDVQGILLDMRKQRLGLIQTPDQLRFSYVAILQGAANILGLEHVAGPPSSESEEEEEEEEEDSVEESESDEEAGPEPSQPTYRYLSNPYRDHLEDNVPPPVPPRPPETFQQYPFAPPPPPPTTLPPGPPVSQQVRRGEQGEGGEGGLFKKIRLDESGEEYGFSPMNSGMQNGTVLEDIESEEEEPPPIPPRDNSLSPEYLRPVQRTDIIFPHSGGATHPSPTAGGPTKDIRAVVGDRFLSNEGGEGERGTVLPPGGDSLPPPPPPCLEPTGAGTTTELGDAQATSGRSSSHVFPEGDAPPLPPEAEMELRKRERVERNARISDKVHSMKKSLREQEQAEKKLSVPWLLVGFGAVIGYCIFYMLYAN